MKTQYKQALAFMVAILLVLAQANYIYAAEAGGFPLAVNDSAASGTVPTEPKPQPPTNNAPQEPLAKQEIVRIFNLNLFINSCIIAVDDNETWQEEQSIIQELFSLLGGLTAQEVEAGLTAEFIDFSAVSINEVGSYEITLRLKLTEEYADAFFLPEALAAVRIPVYIADPKEFALYPSAIKPNQIVAKWLYPSSSKLPISVFYGFSDTPLTSEQLKLRPCDNTMAVATESNSVLKINREALQTDLHYYFQIEQNGVYSDILHLVDDGKEIASDGMGGDRDGGDRDEQTPPPVTITPPAVTTPNEGGESDDDSDTPPSIKEEPIPTTPKPSAPQETPNSTPQEPKTENSEDKKPIAVPEEDTKNYTVFSGRRLLQMQKTSDTLRVKKNHITVDMPWEWEGFSTLTEESRFKVEILSRSKNSVWINVLLNDAPPLAALPITVTMPYTPTCGEVSLTVSTESGAIYPAAYDAALQTITFTADKTGTFTVLEQAEESAVAAPDEPAATIGSAEPKSNASPFSVAVIAGIAILLLAVGFFWVRRMRKAGHTHE